VEWRLIKADAEQPVEPHIPYRVRIYAELYVQWVFCIGLNKDTMCRCLSGLLDYINSSLQVVQGRGHFHLLTKKLLLFTYSLLLLFRIGWTIFYQKVFKSVRDQVWYKFFLKMCNFKGWWRGWRGQSFPPSVCLSILSKVSLCIRIKTKQIHHTPLSGVTLN